MKEVVGRIVNWDTALRQGLVRGDDETLYPCTSKEWMEEQPPEVDGGVLVICQNGRDASQVEYLAIEHIPFAKVTTYSEEGEIQTESHTRFIGGPWRIRSDALVWMEVAKGLHEQNAGLAIEDISHLLIWEHPQISLRGSVIKYCYGISIELYLKWILIDAKAKYRSDHKIPQLVRRLPAPVLENLRGIYSDFQRRYAPQFRISEAHVHGVTELKLDWSKFDSFIENLVKQKFIVGRYADPSEYSIFRSRSAQSSREMNSFIDSNDFFILGERILAHKPEPSDYE